MGVLEGKVAVVTGGRQGIGRGIVDAFFTEGARVVTCGRGKRPADLPEAIQWTSCDVTDSMQAEMVSEIVGPCDVLVNNAGVQVEKTVADSTDEEAANRLISGKSN